MKYLILGTAILGVLLCVCLVSALQSAYGIDALQEPLRAAYPALCRGDLEDARPLLEEAAAQWEQQHEHLDCVLGHGEADEVEHGFRRMDAYLKTGDLPELRATYEELQAMLEHLRNIDLPYYYNLL